jgi:hypothetical protein
MISSVGSHPVERGGTRLSLLKSVSFNQRLEHCVRRVLVKFDA